MVQGVLIENGVLKVRNPANGEIVGQVKCTTVEEVNQAISRAKVAQVAWSEKSLDERVQLLRECLEELSKHTDELAETITKEMGKVLSEAEDEVRGATHKDYWLELVQEANEPIIVGHACIVRDPHGVVAVCSPWNFPADEILLLAFPALAAGNTVVLKPSEVVPMTGAIVARALQAVLPQGVVEIVQGDGAVGAALVAGDVQMVAMTGSSATGRKIMAACAKDLKRLVLELGGKDPMIVFADADLDRAANDAVTFSLFNCGQVCCSVERIYVEQSAKEDFERRCQAIMKEWVVGDGFDAKSRIGPMVSGMQKEIVAEQVADAEKRGAKVLFRGDVPLNPRGNYYPPTLLTDVTPDMLISNAETFGPVVCVTAFDGSEAEAIRLCNSSEYGLAAYVYTQDLQKAKRVGMKVKAGQVGVNNWSLAKAPPECPWVGAKNSGFGFHSGEDGWRQFSVPKSIIFNEEHELDCDPVWKDCREAAIAQEEGEQRQTSLELTLFVAVPLIVGLVGFGLGFMMSRRR